MFSYYWHCLREESARFTNITVSGGEIESVNRFSFYFQSNLCFRCNIYSVVWTSIRVTCLTYRYVLRSRWITVVKMIISCVLPFRFVSSLSKPRWLFTRFRHPILCVEFLRASNSSVSEEFPNCTWFWRWVLFDISMHPFSVHQFQSIFSHINVVLWLFLKSFPLDSARIRRK